MSQAMDDLKAFLLKHGAAPYVASAARAGRPDAGHVTLRMALERRGMKPVMAAGLARAFAALVKERLARGAG